MADIGYAGGAGADGQIIISYSSNITKFSYAIPPGETRGANFYSPVNMGTAGNNIYARINPDASASITMSNIYNK